MRALLLAALVLVALAPAASAAPPLPHPWCLGANVHEGPLNVYGQSCYLYVNVDVCPYLDTGSVPVPCSVTLP